MLQAAGIYDVQVRHVSGSLTDHYDPRTKTVNLSDPVYNATSVAALGVAAMSVDTLYSMQKAMHLFQSGVHLCL